MTNQQIPSNPSDALRRKAEERILASATKMRESLSSGDPQRTLHELLVNQVELEMQNEELGRTQLELEASQSRYFDLYDLAPVGYFTLSEAGLILESNLTFANLLGVTRSDLIAEPLTHFIVREDQDIYAEFRKALLGTSAPQAVELRLRPAVTRPPLWVRLQATAARDQSGVLVSRVVASDITDRMEVEQVHSFLSQCGYLRAGEDFFQHLARYLAQHLAMDYVCIDSLEGDGLVAQTVAVYSDGKFEDNVRYTLKDTPCGDVVDKTVCCFSRDVRHLFPRDVVLQEMKAESYVGTTLLGYDGRQIGLIAVIGRKPLTKPLLVEGVLRLVAVRAAGELERRRAQEALQDAAEHHRLALEAADLGTWDYDFVTGTVHWDERCRAIFGVPSAETIDYATALSIIHAEDRERVDRAVQGALQPGSGGGYEEEFRVVWPNDTVRSVVGRGQAYFQGDGSARRALRFIGTVRDITVDALAKDELQRRETELRLLLEHSNDAIFWADAETGILIRCNRKAEELTGRSRNELVGMHQSQLHPPDPKYTEVFRRAAALPLAENIEADLISRDGKQTPVIINSSVVSFGQRRIIQGIFRDITEQRRLQENLQQARRDLELRVDERTRDLKGAVSRLEAEVAARIEMETALRESEERYRTLISSAPIGIALTDAAGRMRDANAALCDMLGVTQQEVLAAELGSFFAKSEDLRRLFRRVRRETRVGDYETLLRRKDATEFHVSLQLTWIQLRQEQLFLWLVTDLTRRRHAERQVLGIAALQELFLTQPIRQNYLRAVVRFLREWADCRCAGIRLLDHKGHLPFVASLGFNPTFLKEENQLCLDAAACPCLPRLRTRPRQLESPCTRIESTILRNDLDHLRERPTAAGEDRTAFPCVKARYASVAHAPIRYGDSLLGIIQLADTRNNRFPMATAQFLHSVTTLVGEALHRFSLESELKDSEERFRSLFEHHQAVMFLVERKSGAIVDANEAAAQFYGYSRTRLTRMSISDLGTQLQRLVRKRRSSSMGADYKAVVHPHRLANGLIRAVEIHSTPVAVQGRKLLFLIIHDVTERRLLERRLLDVADRERQRIGRDLHDSLGGSLSGLAMLGKVLAKTLSPRSRKQAAIAKEIIQGINEAVGRTRLIARGLCPVGLSAFGFVSGLHELARGVEKRHGVRCHLRASRDVLVKEDLVASHLFQIVEEAVNNAVRHGKAREIEIALERDRGDLRLRVRDDGIGLPKNLARSSGMGLRTMRYRADVLGGILEIQSSKNQGTVISCLLPAKDSLS